MRLHFCFINLLASVSACSDSDPYQELYNASSRVYIPPSFRCDPETPSLNVSVVNSMGAPLTNFQLSYRYNGTQQDQFCRDSSSGRFCSAEPRNLAGLFEVTASRSGYVSGVDVVTVNYEYLQGSCELLTEDLTIILQAEFRPSF